MTPSIPKVEYFKKGPRKYKYTAVMKDGSKVNFGHKDYQHYKDQVPKKMGGGLWTHKNHGDSARRKNYRKRHGGMVCKDGSKCITHKYSPAWFSYYFLW
jgi:hypothetical protein